MDFHVGIGDVSKFHRVVGRREDCFTEVLPHFIPIDIKSGHEFDIPNVVTAKIDVHDSRNKIRRLSVFIIVHSLN